jgi:hypothetical protein
METAINRKQTAFRLSTELLKRLKQAAVKENRSLNNFVENVLMTVVYKEPNKDTEAAIEEARAGKFSGTIDMKNFDSFMNSVNEIE